MSINPGDFKVSIIPTDPDIDFLECVIGESLDVEIDFSNDSFTDPLYNINVTLSLPNGLSYVSASILESSNIIDNSFNNVVTFINIKDLYEREQNFKFKVTLKSDSFYRGTNLPVSFNAIIAGISVKASCDTMPRGSFDIGNVSIDATSSIALNTFRFSGRFTGPAAYLKGAGIVPGDNIDATQIFNVSLNLTNNSRTTSNVSLLLSLANGIRYIGVWSTSGTNAANFLNPVISEVSQTQDHVQISFNNKTLSVGSKTTLTFQIAIWDKYTVNGIENSGDTILYGDILSTSFSLQGNGSSYTEQYSLSPLEINIIKDADSDLTDVDVINEFKLTYQTSEYLSVNNVILTDILPDGMSFINDSTLTPTNVILNPDGTTNVLWDLGSLPTNSSSSIVIHTKTNSTYSSTNFVYSTDTLINTLNLKCNKDINGAFINAFAYKKLTIVSPLLTKEVIGYYYEDMSEKPFNVATIGDYVGFKITYDARNVAAKQKDVIFYDYPPLNILMTTVPSNIVVTGDFPAGAVPLITANNGVIMNLGNLNGKIHFTIATPLQVTSGTEDSDIYNLAKIQLKNSTLQSTSVRDNALVSFGEPHIHITNSISSNSCISNGKSLTYSIDIKNYSDEEVNYVTDGFNLVLTSTLPSIYNITSTPTVTGSGTFSQIQVINNVLTLNVTKLPPNANLLITAPLTVSTPPIMSQNYNLPSVITPGTSQQRTTSYHYLHGDYPLDDETVLAACNAEISKSYIQPVNKLGDYYKSTISITIPKGILCYNNKIKDSTLTTDTSYIANVKLNGTTIPYSLSTNNIQIVLPSTLDTTAEAVNYYLEYDNRVMSANPVNYEDSRVIQCSLDWSNTLTYPEVYSKSASAPFTIFTPGINVTKYQSNITQGTAYDIDPIYAIDYDNIKYKLTLSNVGKAPAYNVVVVDTIPSALQYNSCTGGVSSFNSLTSVLTVTVPFISTDSSQDIIIDTMVANDASDTVATNTAFLQYKANTNLPNFYGNSTSNIVNLIKDNLSIIKYQRNVTAGDSFTTSEIRCIKDQSIQYKVTIKNTSNNSLSDISVTDTFPAQFNFISFEAFTLGTLTVNNKVVTCNVSSLPANATLEFIYTIKLSNDTFARSSSKSTINYKFLGGLNIFTKDSNRVYIVCSTLGRGYMIY